jgi:hypothetical protein
MQQTRSAAVPEVGVWRVEYMQQLRSWPSSSYLLIKRCFLTRMLVM